MRVCARISASEALSSPTPGRELYPAIEWMFCFPGMLSDYSKHFLILIEHPENQYVFYFDRKINDHAM